jgi:hypothetical protein
MVECSRCASHGRLCQANPFSVIFRKCVECLTRNLPCDLLPRNIQSITELAGSIRRAFLAREQAVIDVALCRASSWSVIKRFADADRALDGLMLRRRDLLLCRLECLGSEESDDDIVGPDLIAEALHLPDVEVDLDRPAHSLQELRRRLMLLGGPGSSA